MTNITSLGGAAPATAHAQPLAATQRSAPPLDRARLDALRSAIQAGRYPLDPAKLAERMVSVNAVGPE